MPNNIFEKLEQAYKENDKKLVKANLIDLTDLARGGDSRAQYLLAQAYSRGIGISPDEQEAISWWTLAAKGGDVDAQYNLGCSYMRGEGVNQDSKKALAWLKKAADQGDIDALVNIASIYEVLLSDIKNAKKFYQKAADKGDTEAADKLKQLLLNDDVGLNSESIELGMSEHHQVIYRYKCILTKEKLQEIYSDLSEDEILDLMSRIRDGSVEVVEIENLARERSVDLEWDRQYEDVWTDRKGGYSTSYDLYGKDE